MKNIQTVSDSYLCSNCGACSAICPKDAIDFQWSSIGRLYAKVNDKCIDCGLCQKVCPTLDSHRLQESFEDKYVGEIKKAFVGRSNNEHFFRNSQSGGVTTGILAHLFEVHAIDAAVVCQMEYGTIPQVRPVIIESIEQLPATQKSCYTPVALLSILNQTAKYKSVAIVGLPCHLQGVTALQQTSRQFDNIKYKLGLVCDRTECAGIMDVMKDFVGYDSFKIGWRKKYDEQTQQFNYQSAPIVAQSPDGRKQQLPRSYRIALKDMFTSPRCRVCWDKINVFADITLGDPWRLTDTDTIKGENLIIARTDTGLSLLMDMQEKQTVTIREYDKEAPLRSQLIEDRRKQVMFYTDNQEYIESFAKLENTSEEEVLAIAKEAILKHQAKVNRNNSLVHRIINKVKRIIKN